MKARLLLVPVVVCPVALVAAGLWLSGLCWPIATQTWSLLAPRPHVAYDEDDVIA